MRAKLLVTALLIASAFKTEIIMEPEWILWGNPEYIHYDAERDVFVNANTQIEHWRVGTPCSKPEEVPVKRTTIIVLRFWEAKLETRHQYVFMMAALNRPRRRFVLVNVEQTIVEANLGNKHYRVWPHLGMLYVGTAAREEDWDVIMWDELVQGYCDLEKLVQPGDVVGLSLVVTGVERGVGLAQQAKSLGASMVIAGNDSAIFRANEILALPDRPVDAVFTTNSLTSIRTFFRHFGTAKLPEITGVARKSGEAARSNVQQVLLSELRTRKELERQGAFDVEDVFVIPKFDLFPQSYWDEVWSNYREVFGHKHRDGNAIRNGIALFAQGCTRTRGTNACSYCAIAGVGDIRIPSEDYLRRTLEAYDRMGISMVFNTTDSAYEMRPLVQRLKNVGAKFDALTIYGRAQGIALHPELLDNWLSFVSDRLLLNIGMDSGDDKILAQGVMKSSSGKGSRIEENQEAMHHIRKSGVHLHYSLIFGSPGETIDSCERSIDFLEWSIAELGPQLDVVESDIYWLNFGSPVSEIFTDYEKARELAAIAGKEISHGEWYQGFARHASDLVIPESAKEAWYRHFTNIDLGMAQAYNRRVTEIMTRHEGAIAGRAFKPV